ncbi:ABC transporter ATP-binding protein [Paradesulfitobacterium aromaticivorans]
MLKINDLVTGYSSIEVLHGISMNIEQGEAIGVLGANGAGKTTLLKSIMGLLKPLKGEILLNNAPVTGMTANLMVQKGVVLVPEGRGIFYPLTVAENLELGYLVVKGRTSKTEWDQRIQWVLDLFPELGKRWKQCAGTLSGGQQQMLAIGRALMSQPKILLLDEPSLGLAPLVVDSIIESLRYLVDSGMTVILVEQKIESALELVNRAYVLSNGKIVYLERSEVLKNVDSELLEKAYLGS